MLFCFLQFFELTKKSFIQLRKTLASLDVIVSTCKDRIFHKYNRSIRMFVADDVIKFIHALFHLLYSNIRNEIENKDTRVYTRHKFCHFKIKESISTET